jgi:release factor glutamine methyltransferase
MIISELILHAGKLLSATSTTPQLDSEVLLAHILHKDRSWIHAHPESICKGQTLVDFNLCIERRVAGEPVAYITGNKEFYGRDFAVNKDVLVPRPESESFIELLRPLLVIKPPKGILHVLDLGTGSGCLAITIKKEFPNLYVYASDTSNKALVLAIKNAKLHEADIIFKDQDLLTGDKAGYDVVVANLPYVPDGMREPSILHEPTEALYSGVDGLQHYKRLFRQLAPKHIRYVLTESLETQHDEVNKLAEVAQYSLVNTQGLVQLFMKNK